MQTMILSTAICAILSHVASGYNSHTASSSSTTTRLGLSNLGNWDIDTGNGATVQVVTSPSPECDDSCFEFIGSNNGGNEDPNIIRGIDVSAYESLTSVTISGFTSSLETNELAKITYTCTQGGTQSVAEEFNAGVSATTAFSWTVPNLVTSCNFFEIELEAYFSGTGDKVYFDQIDIVGTTLAPTAAPTDNPTTAAPTAEPTAAPTDVPTAAPIVTAEGYESSILITDIAAGDVVAIKYENGGYLTAEESGNGLFAQSELSSEYQLWTVVSSSTANTWKFQNRGNDNYFGINTDIFGGSETCKAGSSTSNKKWKFVDARDDIVQLFDYRRAYIYLKNYSENKCCRASTADDTSISAGSCDSVNAMMTIEKQTNVSYSQIWTLYHVMAGIVAVFAIVGLIFSVIYLRKCVGDAYGHGKVKFSKVNTFSDVGDSEDGLIRN